MRRILLIVLVSLPLLVHAVWASNLTAHFIDIGQGDATLITYQNWTIMIDSGDRFNAQRDKMQSYLAELNVTTINLAIATHADADHIGPRRPLGSQVVQISALSACAWYESTCRFIIGRRSPRPKGWSTKGEGLRDGHDGNWQLSSYLYMWTTPER